MEFYEKIKEYKNVDFENYFKSITANDVKIALSKDNLNEKDFLALLSPAAEEYIEAMAQKAHRITLNQFGRSIVLYTPIYLANYCVNKCAYCGYNVENKIGRKKLTLEEVEAEAKSVSKTGLKHIVILTGESRFHTPISYIKDCVKVLRKYFSSISIEIYPVEKEEYEELIEAGVDSLTLYQEVYDEKVYDNVHISGPKKDYLYRLNGPERACMAKIHSLSIGALLGLSDWRSEAFFSGLHGSYIQGKYPEVELNLSIPRIRPHVGSFTDVYEVTDKNVVQAMLAYKIYLPRVGINVTTRESQDFRDNLIPLGVTKMSAGVSTEVGGHSDSEKSEGQFEIADDRSVQKVMDAISKKGYNAVLKDWEPLWEEE